MYFTDKAKIRRGMAYLVRETETTLDYLPELDGWSYHELRWERMWEEKIWAEKIRSLVLNVFLLRCLLGVRVKGSSP